MSENIIPQKIEKKLMKKVMNKNLRLYVTIISPLFQLPTSKTNKFMKDYMKIHQNHKSKY